MADEDVQHEPARADLDSPTLILELLSTLRLETAQGIVRAINERVRGKDRLKPMGGVPGTPYLSLDAGLWPG